MVSLKIFNTKEDLWFRLTVVPLIGILTPFFTNVLPVDVSIDLFFVKFPYLYTLFAVVLLFEVNRLSLRFFRKKFKSFSSIVVRLIIQLFLLIIITLALLYFILTFWYHNILNIVDFSSHITNNLYVGLSVAVIFTMYYEMSYYISVWQKENLINQKLELENVRSQLIILKNQLSPHFMFNSLSTLSALIESDKDEAMLFLDKFSYAYRYFLTHGDEALTSVIDELDYIQNYFSIVKTSSFE